MSESRKNAIFGISSVESVCIHQAEPFADTALAQTLLHLRSDVEEGAPPRVPQTRVPCGRISWLIEVVGWGSQELKEM